MKYPYIAIEGVIGAGKTTVSNFLANKLGANLLLEEYVDNPFLEKFYADKKTFSFPLELSFLASRYHQVQNHIEPASLFQQQIVSDFVLYKSLVFASINLVGDELELYKKLFHIMFQQIPKPDITFYIRHSTDALLQNISKRGRAYELGIDTEYLEALDTNYFAYFTQLTQHRIVVLDGKKFDIISDVQAENKWLSLLKTDFPLGITYL
jgi:deoxyguanosine kinase